jgi:hypothetical protein
MGEWYVCHRGAGVYLLKWAICCRYSPAHIRFTCILIHPSPAWTACIVTLDGNMVSHCRSFLTTCCVLWNCFQVPGVCVCGGGWGGQWAVADTYVANMHPPSLRMEQCLCSMRMWYVEFRWNANELGSVKYGWRGGRYEVISRWGAVRKWREQKENRWGLQSTWLEKSHIGRISSSEMSRLVSLLRIDVSEESISSMIRVTRICELGTTLALTSIRNTLASCLGC